MELNNTESECTIGVFDAENDKPVYRPVIMWNLSIETYLSQKDSSYRSYGCIVKVKGKQGQIKSFKVFIKEGDFAKFERVRAAIVAQTFGELILNSRFNLSMWSMCSKASHRLFGHYSTPTTSQEHRAAMALSEVESL